MSGVGIICFAASYAIALILELYRFFFRSSIGTVFAFAWTLAGLFAHTAYLYYHHSISTGPVHGIESYFLVSAWGLVLVYLYLFRFHPKIPFGLIFLPIILLLIGGGITAPYFSNEIGDSQSVRIISLWRRLHAGTFFLATLSVCVGFTAGSMYLLQNRRLRLKRPAPQWLQLPTLEWSLSVCRRAMGASILFLGACIFSGLLLRPFRCEKFFLVDPLVVGTSLMFVFLLFFFGIFSFRLRNQEGRSVAVLTLLGFLFLVLILLFAVLFRDAHWKRSASNLYKEPDAQRYSAELSVRTPDSKEALR